MLFGVRRGWKESCALGVLSVDQVPSLGMCLCLLAGRAGRGTVCESSTTAGTGPGGLFQVYQGPALTPWVSHFFFSQLFSTFFLTKSVLAQQV